MIAGVVLAAGRSSRMGSPKALLTMRGHSFLALVLRALQEGGCAPVVVVTGPADSPGNGGMREEIRRAGALHAINPDPDSDQIDSLRSALALLPESIDGLVVTPVDAPGASEALVSELLRAASGGAAIVVPTHRGRRGHPVFFGSRLLPELTRGILPEGARSLIRRHERELIEVEVEDASVLLDVDTPSDYRALMEECG